MRVLLTGSSRLGPVPVMKALAAEGARSILAVHPDEWAPAGRSRHCREMWQLPPLEPTDDFIESLLALLRTQNIDVLLPLSDEVIIALAPWRREVERLAAYAAPTAETIANAVDKGRMARLLAGRNDVFQPPLTVGPDDPEHAAGAWPGRFPVLIKPRTASGAAGVTLARDREELDAVYRQVHAHFPLPIIQQHLDYAPGDKIKLCYVFDKGGRMTASSMVRVLEERSLIGVGAGSATRRGGISLTFVSDHDAALLERGRRTMEALGWRGHGFVEAVRDPVEGEFRIIDINPRLCGTIPLSLSLGLNYAWDSCLVALGRTPPDRSAYSRGVRGRRSVEFMDGDRTRKSALTIFDPRYRTPVSLFEDPVPVLHNLVRLGGAAWTRYQASHATAVPAA